MTEVINVQVTCFVEGQFNSDSLNLKHKGINFHLEISNFMSSKLNLLNEKSLQVFVLNHIEDTNTQAHQNMLNNVKSKVLIVEIPYRDIPSLENFAVYGYYMFFNKGMLKKIYYDEEFLDKLLEMSLENEIVLESSVVNDIFSQFLNKERVEENVIKNFCDEKRLNFPKCVTILKNNGNLFEYSNAYYFIYKKSLEFVTKIHTFGYHLKNGITTYEELQRLFNNHVDVALEFLEHKNIIIKGKNNYGYVYNSNNYYINSDPYRKENFNFFENLIPDIPKTINLRLELKTPIGPEFFGKISKNREISSVGNFHIFLENNAFIGFDHQYLKIYFHKEYDLNIIFSTLTFIESNTIEIAIKNEYKIGQQEIEYYFEENFEEDFYEGYIKYYNEEIEDVKSIIKVIYPIITNN